jgi:hypothetical protein
MKQRRWLAYGLLLGAVGLAACGKSESPPAPQAQAPAATPAPAPDVNAEVQRLAAEVYVYAYPLVLTDATRTANAGTATVNTFAHKRTVPDATTTDVDFPNADFLYSQAWLDLSREPVVLSIPDTRGRYYLIALLDGWTNVAASLGKRTTGTEKRELAITGPRWKGTLPDDVTQIKAPTELAWLFGRTQVNDRNDRAAAAKLQEQFKVTPLSQRSKRAGKPAAAATAPAEGNADPRAQVAAMDPATFFTRFAMLLPGNPPTADDKPMQDKMAKIGIVAGQPLDLARLDPIVARSVEQGTQVARNAIAAGAKGAGTADIRNGWSVDRALGRWGNDYGRRAVAALKGLGVNAPEDAIFMTANFDAGGHKLDGANRYVLHFDKDQLPPTEAFWSVSVYDDKHHFVANRLDRHHLGSTDNLKVNPDGSIDLVIQNADPGPDQAANWLPAHAGPFNVILRIYWPRQQVLDGHWTAPGIRRAA